MTQQCFFIRLYNDTTVQVGYTITRIKKKFFGYCDFSQLSANNEVEHITNINGNAKPKRFIPGTDTGKQGNHLPDLQFLLSNKKRP